MGDCNRLLHRLHHLEEGGVLVCVLRGIVSGKVDGFSIPKLDRHIHCSSQVLFTLTTIVTLYHILLECLFVSVADSGIFRWFLRPHTVEVPAGSVAARRPRP
jgi:hypothetical protein